MNEYEQLENPFDFRTPVKTAQTLVGRQWQLRWFVEGLRRLGTGRPAHALVLGPNGYGKTSLLNVYAEEALNSGFLPVRFCLNDSTVSSGEAFFEALLTSAMLALEDTRKFDEDPVFITWLAQVGRVEPGPQRPTLISHAQPFTDPTTLARDCRVISSLARQVDLNGVVLLMDDADVLRDDDVITHALKALIESLSDWMFVIAGQPDILDDLATTAPGLQRVLTLIPVTPITSVFDISELLFSPLDSALREKAGSDITDFIDLAYAAGGSPRRMKILAHHMWNAARRDGFETFKLTTEALEDLLVEVRLQHPGSDVPEHVQERMDFAEAASRISTDDLNELLAIVSMEELTLVEASLAVLAREGVEDDVEERAHARADDVESLLSRLEGEGLVQLSGDRFKVAARSFGTAFLRRLMLERLDRRPDLPAPSYGAFAGATFFERMCSHCSFDDADTDPIIRFRGKLDIESEEAAIHSLASAIRAGSPLALQESEAISLFWETTPPEPDRNRLLLIGVTFNVGVDSTLSIQLERVEVGTLFWAGRQLSAEAARETAQAWFASHEELLAAYRLALDSIVVEIASPELSDQMVAVAAPGSVVERSLDYFGSGQIAEGLSYLERVGEALEAAFAQSATPRLRTALSDTYQRLSFFAALAGTTDLLETALRRAAQLRDTEDWLDIFNSAHLRALRREYAAAGDLVRHAEQCIPPQPKAFMLLYLPAAVGWTPPDPKAKTANVDATSALGVLRTQALVYDAMAGRYSPQEFLREIDDLGPSVSPPQMRLIGWTLFTKYGLDGEAEAQFRRAANSGDPYATAEAEFAARKKPKPTT